MTRQFLQRAMNRIGRDGRFTNTQTRESFINGAMETGIRDNEITSVTGKRSETTLKSYKSSSLQIKKTSSERIQSVRAGGDSWYSKSGYHQRLSVCGPNLKALNEKDSDV